MIFQHKKLQTYHNIPVMREREAVDLDNGEDGNDDGFGGSGSIGGSGIGIGGSAGCKALMGRVMEVQKNQYTDVKREIDRIKSMLNNIYTLLQDDDEDDDDEEDERPSSIQAAPKDAPDTSKSWSRVPVSYTHLTLPTKA